MKSPSPPNLYTQLTLSHLLVAVVSISALSVFAGRSILTASQEQVEHHLEDIAFATSNALEQPMAALIAGNASLTDAHNSIDHVLINEKHTLYTLYLADGTPLFTSDGSLPIQADADTTPDIFDALQNEFGESDLIRFNKKGIDILYVTVRIEHENEVFGVLRLETPLALAMTFTSQRRLLSLLLLSALLIALGVGVVGWFLARNLAHPIEELTVISERLHGGDVTARVTPTGPQEIHLLAESFNSMSSRLQGHMSELRIFVANASHELRTPLTSIKLRTEALRAGALTDPDVTERFLTEIEQEVDRLGNMVNDLLDISRLEAGMESDQCDQVNLGILAEEVCATFAVRAERKNAALKVVSVTPVPTLFANEEQIRRVLTNLIDNALKYLSQGGKVDVEVSVTFAQSNQKT